MTEVAMKRVYVRLSEIPKLYGISRASMYRYEKAGKITIHRGTGVGMVRADDMERMIEGKAA